MKDNPEYDYINARTSSISVSSTDFATRFLRVLSIMCIVLFILGIVVSIGAIVYNCKF